MSGRRESPGIRMTRAPQAIQLLRYVWEHPAARDQRARRMARLVAWQVWQRVTRRPWCVEVRNGVRLRCHPHNTAASGVLYVGYPEWREMRFLIDFLRSGDTFVDVGANVGVYTLLACSIPDVEVWAFEPSTSAFARALENVRLNGLAGRVHLMRAAAGARDGYGHLTLGLDTVNRLDDVGGSGTEAVEVLALGPFLVRAGVDAVKVSVIKVDVEGSEPDVLAGARPLLDVASPALIVERNEPEQLRALLSPKGYAPFDYDPMTRRVAPATWFDDTVSVNMLLCKDLDQVAARLAKV